MRDKNQDLPQWWHDKYGNARIMTITEGYVMWRRPHKMPLVSSLADFKNRFKEGKRP